MTLDPILTAPLLIQLHVLTAIVSATLGPFVLYRRRDRIHKALGYVWITAMAGVALSGLALPAQVLHFYLGFGPIHILCLFVLWGLFDGVRAIQRRELRRHRETMRGLYWNAITIAGLFTFLPGRRMNQMVFPEAEWLGWCIIGAGAAGLALRQWHVRGRIQTA